MIYTFLCGIDAIFRINKSFLFHTIVFFLTFVISILGWIFLRKNKSLLKTCLGFIFLPAFPLFNTLYFYGMDLRRFHIEYFLIYGGVYFIVFVVSLAFILLKTKNKSAMQFVFIALSGLMIFFSQLHRTDYKFWTHFKLGILFSINNAYCFLLFDSC